MIFPSDLHSFHLTTKTPYPTTREDVLSAVLPDDEVGRSCRASQPGTTTNACMYYQAPGTILHVQQLLTIHSSCISQVLAGLEGPCTVCASIALWTVAFTTTVPPASSSGWDYLFAPCSITWADFVGFAFPKCKAGLISMANSTASASQPDDRWTG